MAGLAKEYMPPLAADKKVKKFRSGKSKLSKVNKTSY